MFNFDQCTSLTCLLKEHFLTTVMLFLCFVLLTMLVYFYKVFACWYTTYKSTRPPLNVLFKMQPLITVQQLCNWYVILRYSFASLSILVCTLSTIYTTVLTYQKSVFPMMVLETTVTFVTLLFLFSLITASVLLIFIVIENLVLDCLIYLIDKKQLL